MINYIKGMYKWLYSKKNLKYSLPLITAYVLMLYGPTLFKVYIRPWLQKNTYSSDGRIRFKKHKKSDIENIIDIKAFSDALTKACKEAKHVKLDDLDNLDHPVNE